MIDRELRPVTGRVLDPLARRVPTAVTPLALSVTAAGVGLSAAVAAGLGLVALAVAAWWVSRLLDGLDGAVARQRGVAGDLGGYLDLLLDTVVYAAVPLGVAAHVDERGGWIAVAVLIAAFYVNAVSWAVLSALSEKRARGAAATGERTSVTMPRGLVEGTETIVLFTAMLALPDVAVELFWFMAAAVALGVVGRLPAAVRLLGEPTGVTR